MRSLHWFRQDLRLQDNPALTAAAAADEVLCVYVLDERNAGGWALGGASRWWLHHSLQALDRALDGRLVVCEGDPRELLPTLVEAHAIDAVHWNRCYEPWRIRRDAEIKRALSERGVDVSSHNGSLLWEPWSVTKADKTPYKVFTPFYRKGCLSAGAPRAPLAAPVLRTVLSDTGSDIDALGLLPAVPWASGFDAVGQPGEAGAHARLDAVRTRGLAHYASGRDRPAAETVTRLSPHLQFGELSPNQAWAMARALPDSDDVDRFCTELGWREFSHHLLFHWPSLPSENWQPKFNAMPWRDEPAMRRAWERGRTGIPIVDAGMRELWATGYMHNRVRMVVGSFLVKNLLQHWRHGAAWFHDTLVDASLANNSASWQWVAGSGADAAPFFRIFNPVTQGEKFDAEGEYTRRWVPELARLPNKHLFAPWLAPHTVLADAGVTLGVSYPHPIVDLAASRKAALDALANTKA
ncbi:MAG: deoxyribodipyrimidine photo-lyase [Pseudomonadota bacterium]